MWPSSIIAITFPWASKADFTFKDHRNEAKTHVGPMPIAPTIDNCDFDNEHGKENMQDLHRPSLL
jgi:hypothetical protein